MPKYLFSLIALLMVGCASYQPKPLSPKQMMADYALRSLDNADLQHYIAAHMRNELGQKKWDLERLTLAAYYYNPELDIARAKLVSEQAAAQSAGQSLNPTLSLPFQYTGSATKPWTYGLGLDIPIETANKRGYRIEQAEQQTTVARLKIGETAWQLRGRLRSALLDLYSAEKRMSILQQQIFIQKEILSMQEKRCSLGASSQNEVNQERITLEKDLRDLNISEQQRLDAKTQLATIIGLPIKALEPVGIDLNIFEHSGMPIPTASTRQQAILNRSDLQVALAEYEVTQSALQLEIARQYPNVSLGLGYSFDQGANKYSMTPSGITLPLFNHNEGQIAEAEARRKEAALHVEAIQEQAINETDNALQHYQSGMRELTLANDVNVLQTLALKKIQHEVMLGSADRLSIKQALRTGNINALSQLDAEIKVQQAIGQLENVMQRPLINSLLQTSLSKEAIRK